MVHARLYLCGGCVPDWLPRSLYRGVTVTLSLILLQPRSEKFQQVPVPHCNIYLQIEYIVDRRLWRTPPLSVLKVFFFTFLHAWLYRITSDSQWSSRSMMAGVTTVRHTPICSSQAPDLPAHQSGSHDTAHVCSGHGDTCTDHHITQAAVTQLTIMLSSSILYPLLISGPATAYYRQQMR